MARKNNREKRAGRKSYSLIVDGETEIWYFQMMKRHEDLPRINIKPELPKRKKLADQYEMVIDQAEDGYDKVIWLIDCDTLIKEERERKKDTKSKCFEVINRVIP